ncbi:MAG: hypothetical protein KDD56_01065 [Bdellovibrionales bacterium]|nr:hypothetical protein [Bdellovibrionales bacterium]
MIAQESVLNDSAPQATSIEKPNDSIQKLADEKELANLWRDLIHSLDDRRVNDALTKVEHLDVLKKKLGRDSLRTQSKYLLSIAAKLKQAGLYDEAGLLAEAAVKLSPLLLGVQYDAASFSDNIDFFRLLPNLKELLGYDPAGLISIAVSFIYPFLWANTLAILFYFLLYFVVSPETLIKAFDGTFLGKIPNIARVFLLAFGLTFPLFFGPLWTLFVWSLVYLMLSRNRKWAVFISGAVLIAWGSLIPLRENLNLWIEDARMKSAVEVLSGATSESDLNNIQKLLKERPTDGVLYYALGEYFRRKGQLGEALKAFNRAEIVLGNQPYTKAQRGLVELVRGELHASEKFFSEAEAMGLKSAAFYYNTSKLKIMSLDTVGSTAYYTKAKAKNSLVTKVLDQREEVSGISEKEAIGEINLPFSIILRSAVTPFAKLSVINESVAQLIMPGISPASMLSIGLILLVSSLVFFGKAKRRNLNQDTTKLVLLFQKIVSLIPSGSEIVAGNSGRFFITFAVLIFAIFPLINWPKESLVPFGGVSPGILSFYGLVTFALVFLAVLFNWKRSKV